MTTFNLTKLDGSQVKWEVTNYKEDEQGRVLAFYVKYTDGTYEHFYLSHPPKKQHIIRSFTGKATGAVGGGAIGRPYGTAGVVGVALVGILAEAVLEHVFFTNDEGEYYYYSKESGNQVFRGPLK